MARNGASFAEGAYWEQFSEFNNADEHFEYNEYLDIDEFNEYSS